MHESEYDELRYEYDELRYEYDELRYACSIC